MKIRNPKQADKQYPAPTCRRQYCFRADCKKDAELVLALLRPYLTFWEMRAVKCDIGDTTHLYTDVECEFEIGARGPDYANMLWLIDRLPNCHVASDTLAPVGGYTGERTYRMSQGIQAKRPDIPQLGQAMDAADLELRVNQVEHERLAYTCESLHAAHDRGKTLPSPANEMTPGWLLLANQSSGDLSSTYRVDAIDGDIHRTICGMSQPDARVLTLKA